VPELRSGWLLPQSVVVDVFNSIMFCYRSFIANMDAAFFVNISPAIFTLVYFLMRCLDIIYPIYYILQTWMQLFCKYDYFPPDKKQLLVLSYV